MMGVHYVLPYVKMENQATKADWELLFYHDGGVEKCRKHNMPTQHVGVYDDGEGYNHEHATSYHWINACPICSITSWQSPDKPSPVYRRFFTDAELQLRGEDTDTPRRLSPGFIW